MLQKLKPQTHQSCKDFVLLLYSSQLDSIQSRKDFVQLIYIVTCILFKTIWLRNILFSLVNIMFDSFTF